MKAQTVKGLRNRMVPLCGNTFCAVYNCFVPCNSLLYENIARLYM
jgi:hypothetical protein